MLGCELGPATIALRRAASPAAPDTTAPVLSSPAGEATSDTTAALSVITDTGEGALYIYVSTSITPPDAGDLKAGTGAAWAESKFVTGAGGQTAEATGLAPETTCYAHFLHTDTAGNDSDIATSASFETEAEAQAPTPWTVSTIVIEGSSSTSSSPGEYNPGFYSYRYADYRDDLTVAVRGANGRRVGTLADLDDEEDASLFAFVSSDLAYEPDLITVWIGGNDLGNGSPSTLPNYIRNLTDLYDTYKGMSAVDLRVAWSAPQPLNPNQQQPSYVAYMANLATLLETARDPAVHGAWCDFYIPIAEHPDFAEIGSPLYNGGIHLTSFDEVYGAGGHNRAFEVYRAAVDTIADASRASSSAPYEAVWPADETGLAPETQITRRIVVSGIAHAGIAGGASVSGGDAEVRLNGGAWSEDTADTSAWLYNGDVIDLRLTTGAGHENTVTVSLTIGGETRAIGYTTAADATPASYVHGGVLAVNSGATVGGYTFTGLAFAEGLAVIAIATGLSDGESNVLVTPPTVGGNDAAFVARVTHTAYESIEIWTCPVMAGEHDVAIVYPDTRNRHVLCWGVLQNADPVPLDVQGHAPAGANPPFPTPAVTVPENGVALAWLRERRQGGILTPSTANSPTVLIDRASVDDWQGIAIGSLPAPGGQASFDTNYGNHPRIAIVWGAG